MFEYCDDRGSNHNILVNPVFRESSATLCRNWIKQLISHFIHPKKAVDLNNSPEKSWLSFLTGDCLPTNTCANPELSVIAVANSCCFSNSPKEKWHYCPTKRKIRVKSIQHLYSTFVFDVFQTLIHQIPNNWFLLSYSFIPEHMFR